MPRHRSPLLLFVTFVSLTLLALGAAGAGAAERGAQEVDPELRLVLRQAASDTDGFVDRFDAEVWLNDMSRRLAQRVPDQRYLLELLKHVHYEARRADLKPELVLAVIDVESNFNAALKRYNGTRERQYPLKVDQLLRTRWYSQ